DRPLQCPRCQSYDVDPWGQYHYRPGCKRYWCHGGKRTFNDLTNTLLHQSKRSLPHWILATFLLCLACSSRRIAREVGVHSRTSYRWYWWLRNAALSYEMERQLEGTVEADDLYHTAGYKGQAKQGGKKSLGRRARGRRKKREPGRGHYDKDRPAIIAWVSRQGAVVIQATRDFTVATVQKAADLAVHAGSRLYTDSASSYQALKGYLHEFVNHTKKEYAVLCHEGWFLPRVRETGWFGGFAIFFRTRAGRRGRAIIEEKPPHAPRPGCHPYGITNFGQEPVTGDNYGKKVLASSTPV